MASPISSNARELPPLADAATWRQYAATNLAAFYVWTAQVLGRPCMHRDAVWAISGVYPTPVFRCAIPVRPFDPAEADDVIVHLDQFYADQPETSWWMWQGWPFADPQPQGLTHLLRLPTMVRLPGAPLPPLPPELRVVEATDDVTIAEVERILIDGYPIPSLQPVPSPVWMDQRIGGGPLRMWIGYVDDRAVATATSFADEHINGIHGVTTLPEGRGRGYGTALTAYAISAAPTLPAVLSASALGHGLYSRLGFREVVAHLDLWVMKR